MFPNLKNRELSARNTEAVKASLWFYLLALFHTNSDPMCLPKEEKCCHVNSTPVQSMKAKLHVSLVYTISM